MKTQYTEKVIAAILEGRNITDIAKKAGLNRNTITRYLKDPELQAILADRRAEMREAAMNLMQKSLYDAAVVLNNIIADEETSASTRVYAINTLFTNARAMQDMEEMRKRIDALEESKGQIEALWSKIQGVRR